MHLGTISTFTDEVSAGKMGGATAWVLGFGWDVRWASDTDLTAKMKS